MKNGLKDHEIAQLVNAVTKRINFLYPLPKSLRVVVSETVVKELTRMDRRIDNMKDSSPYPFQIEEYGED